MKFIVEINTSDYEDNLHEPSIQDQIWWAVKDYINDKAQNPDKWDILVNIE